MTRLSLGSEEYLSPGTGCSRPGLFFPASKAEGSLHPASFPQAQAGPYVYPPPTSQRHRLRRLEGGETSSFSVPARQRQDSQQVVGVNPVPPFRYFDPWRVLRLTGFTWGRKRLENHTLTVRVPSILHRGTCEDLCSPRASPVRSSCATRSNRPEAGPVEEAGSRGGGWDFRRPTNGGGDGRGLAG